MRSRINKIKRDLRALKKGAHAIERLIEIQGTHFKRIEALSCLPKSQATLALIEKEREIVARLGLDREIEKNAEIEERYLKATEQLSLTDKAMLFDCYTCGKPYWKIGMEYGFSEEGARKHIDAIIRKIAKIEGNDMVLD